MGRAKDDRGWSASGKKWRVVCDDCGVVRDRSKGEGKDACPVCGSGKYTLEGEV